MQETCIHSILVSHRFCNVCAFLLAKLVIFVLSSFLILLKDQRIIRMLQQTHGAHSLFPQHVPKLLQRILTLQVVGKCPSLCINIAWGAPSWENNDKAKTAMVSSASLIFSICSLFSSCPKWALEPLAYVTCRAADCSSVWKKYLSWHVRTLPRVESKPRQSSVCISRNFHMGNVWFLISLQKFHLYAYLPCEPIFGEKHG